MVRPGGVALALLLWHGHCERYALIFSGAVSRRGGQLIDRSATDLEGEYSDIEFCAATMKRHVVAANGGSDHWDVFIHSWNPDLEGDFRSIYDFAAADFEENDPYLERLSGIYANAATGDAWRDYHFGALSHSVSHAKGALLVLDHERETGERYDRYVLTRPDVAIFKDLRLDRLSRSRGAAYCNSFGGAAGDFHFVLERWHLEAVARNLATVLALAAARPRTPPDLFWLTSNHGGMRSFLSAALNGTGCNARGDPECRGVVANDGQVIAGIDEEVYRKTPFHLLLECPKPVVQRAMFAHFVQFYGLSDEVGERLRKVAARPRCPGRLHKEPFFAALNFCCANYNRTDEGTFGTEMSVCRNFGKGFPPCEGRGYH